MLGLPGLCAGCQKIGGTYVEVGWTEAITDGNLVTGPAWTAHPEWLAQFLKVLGAKIELQAAAAA